MKRRLSFFALAMLCFPNAVFTQTTIEMPVKDVPVIDHERRLRETEERIRQYERELSELEGRNDSPEKRNPTDRERPDHQPSGNQAQQRAEQNRQYEARQYAIHAGTIRVREIMQAMDIMFGTQNTYQAEYDQVNAKAVVTLGAKEIVVDNSSPKQSANNVLGFDQNTQLFIDSSNNFSQRTNGRFPVDQQIHRMIQEDARSIVESLFPQDNGQALESLSKLNAMEKTWGSVVDKVGRDGPFGYYLGAIRQDLKSYKEQITQGNISTAEHELINVTEQYERIGYEILSTKIQQTLFNPKILNFSDLSDSSSIISALDKAKEALNAPSPDFFKAAEQIVKALEVLKKPAGVEEFMFGPEDFILMGLPGSKLVGRMAANDVKVLLKAGMTEAEINAARIRITQAVREAVEIETKTAVIKIAGEVIEYSANHLGPLSKIMAGGGKTVAETFFESKYIQRTLMEDETFYRYFDDVTAKDLGGYLTKSKFSSPQSAIDKLALENGNKATKWVEIRVPKGTVIYEGLAAPAKNMTGMGSQIFTFAKKEWMIKYGSF